MTALSNLDAICSKKALVSKNRVGRHGINYQNIAHLGAQGVRSQRLVLDPPGGLLHDYVPFYFAPRSPMLSAIHNGRVDGCQLKQQDIIYFETTVDRVVDAHLEFVFYDRNATLSYSNSFTDLRLMSSVIAWDLLTEPPQLDGYCMYFFDKADKYVDRMERRQAEFIIKNYVPFNCFTRVGVINDCKKNEVSTILLSHGLELNVDIMTEWYFLGQKS